MKNNFNLKRGDIVWLNARLVHKLGTNVQSITRPYVVISNNVNNKFCPTINLASLSTQINKTNYPMHVIICKDKYNLKCDSIILTEQLITVNKNQVSRVVDRLDAEDLDRLNRALYIQVINENISFSH